MNTETRVINLTPHTIRVRGLDGRLIALEPTAPPARIDFDITRVATVEVGDIETPIVNAVPVDVLGLPEPQQGTFFIVSRLVAEHAHRADLLVPTGVRRSTEGRPLWCTGWAQCGVPGVKPD